MPFPQILREYLNYLDRLVTLLGGDRSQAQDHASFSLAINSQLNQMLRSGEQQRAQDKVFEMVTIDQLQVPRARDWEKMGMRVLLPNFLDHIFFLLTSLILSPSCNFPDSILFPATPLPTPSSILREGNPPLFSCPPVPNLCLSPLREWPLPLTGCPVCKRRSHRWP